MYSVVRLLGQMDNVLDISFPSPVPELLEIVGFLFLDLRKFVKLDCVSLVNLLQERRSRSC